MRSPVDLFVQGGRDGVYPGGQLAISREGVRVAEVATGVLEPGGAPTDERVVYDLASLTKPLATALLAGRALEAGLLRLEDPLALALPGLDPALTFAHALDHSTGYPAHLRFDLDLPEGVAPGTFQACREIVRRAAETPRERPPGQAAVYSDLGFIVLGGALEALFHAPLSNVFAALGTALFFQDRRGPPARPPDAQTAVFAPTEHGLVGQVHDENARAMGGAAGHAGLFGTALGVLALAEDLVRSHHGARGGLLEPETVRRLWAPSLVPGSTRTLGWDRPSLTGSSTGGRWPRGSVGHLGFTGTSVWIEPERALVAVLVTNRVCPTRANEAIRTFRPALYDAIWEIWG